MQVILNQIVVGVVEAVTEDDVIAASRVREPVHRAKRSRLRVVKRKYDVLNIFLDK